MTNSPHVRPTRLLALLFVGPCFLAALLILVYLHFRTAQAGISGFIAGAFALRPIKAFGMQYLTKILIPIYLVGGILFWVGTLAAGSLFRPAWFRSWTGRQAFGLGLSAMLWAHLVLWWQVPTTLWLLAGLRSVPFWLLFLLLGLAALAYPLRFLAKGADLGRLRAAGTLAAWLILWTLLTLCPAWIPRPAPASRGGNQPCKVLMLGIDGLRSDTFLAHAGELQGLRYRNSYTVIPATRLLWHILWGGDTLTYTIGHVGSTLDEFTHPHTLTLLRDAKAQGWMPRFYIDDGGTISIAGRQMDLDDALMPAAGWENFINSNLAANFPFYAVWENWMKPFPTTNPWAPLDGGLKEALRLGRGSAWTMFHTCLAHQPILLDRAELARTGRWWTLPPRAYEPKPHIGLVTPQEALHPDPRTNPFLAYQIRMDSILRAWEPIWNGLARDPQYGGAARFLFSDHGERFHTVANGFHLQGIHGYGLDPWECRTAMLVAGPGFSDQVVPEPREKSLSLLSLAKGVRRLLDKRGPLDAAFLESSEPVAPIRYHSLATSAFGPEPFAFKAESEKEIAANSYVAPGGVFYTEYSATPEERAKEASIAWGEGEDLYVCRPLKSGGAKKFHYKGYVLQEILDMDEAAFQREKARVEGILAQSLDS